MSSAALPNSCDCNVAALPDRGRVLPFTSAGGAKPIAGRGGLEGFTPPHRFKARTAAFDGQQSFTRAARSAGLRFAVILLSKAMDIGRDHLIHRCRGPPSPRGATADAVLTSSTANAVPLPLIGEGLNALEIGAGVRISCAFNFTLHSSLFTLFFSTPHSSLLTPHSSLSALI